MSDALSQAVSRRGVRVGAVVPAVVLPVYPFGAKVPRGLRQENHAAAAESRFKAVERAGETARRAGLRVNPYHPVKAAAWYNAWQRGWERG